MDRDKSVSPFEKSQQVNVSNTYVDSVTSWLGVPTADTGWPEVERFSGGDAKALNTPIIFYRNYLKTAP